MEKPVKIRPGQTIVITPLEALLVHDNIEKREELAARARRKLAKKINRKKM